MLIFFYQNVSPRIKEVVLLAPAPKKVHQKCLAPRTLLVEEKQASDIFSQNQFRRMSLLPENRSNIL